jgi:flagellum-specific peptidoglycan hydrolase FlgJ
MATILQLFLQNEFGAARLAGHLFPDYAACEAALETGWGSSELFQHANNVFGEKQHTIPIYMTARFPTREMQNGAWVTVEAEFVWFPTTSKAFQSRMDTLHRLASVYPEYAAALSARTGEEFVVEVSKRWSTDPDRAQKVLEIYAAHRDVFGGAV